MVNFRKIIENITKKLKKEDITGNVAEIDEEKKINRILEEIGDVKKVVKKVPALESHEKALERMEGISKEKGIKEQEIKKQVLAGKISLGEAARKLRGRDYTTELINNLISRWRIEKEEMERNKMLTKAAPKIEEYQDFRKKTISRLFRRGGAGIKKTGRKLYEGKPSKNVSDVAKIILPIIAIIIGIAILILLPGLWIIGIPAIIIGLGYLFFVIPTLNKFGFKQKIGFLLIVAGALMVLLVHSFLYGGIMLGLGIIFIVYGQLTGKAKLGFKVLELIITLALLVLVVPSFLNWAGISISLTALAIFSALNTFALFVLWSFSGGQSVKDSLEEELLRKQIEKTEAETEDLEEKGKKEEGVEEAYKKGYEEKNKMTKAGEDWIKGAGKWEEEPIQKKEEIKCPECGTDMELVGDELICPKCKHMESIK